MNETLLEHFSTLVREGLGMVTLYEVNSDVCLFESCIYVFHTKVFTPQHLIYKFQHLNENITES